jgi:cobalt-zinc-cadmium efflux system protein
MFEMNDLSGVTSNPERAAPPVPDADGHRDHDHAGHDHADDAAIAEALDKPAGRAERRPLVIALAISATFLVVEVIGAYISNSLALLADAAHMLTDVAAIGLALFAIWLARRPTSPERTFGYLRAEILAALANAVTLIVMAIYIFWEAWHRLQDPPEVKSGPLLVVATAGLLANIAAAWVLSRGEGHKENLNTRGAYLHVIGDLFGSVATIVAALVIAFTGWYAADPVLSALIGLLVVYGAWSLLRESVDVLLEAAPRGMVIADVRKAMTEVPGVEGVHDLHIWTVTSGMTALSAHIETDNPTGWEACMTELARMLRDRFDIAHVTLQPEQPHAAGDSWDRCLTDAPNGSEICATASRPRQRAVHAGHRH